MDGKVNRHLKTFGKTWKLWALLLIMMPAQLFGLGNEGRKEIQKAEILARSGKYDEAILHLKSALDDDKSAEIARFEIARMLFLKKETKKAINYFERFCKKFPKSAKIPWCYHYLAILHNPGLSDIDQVLDRFYDSVFRYSVLRRNITYFPELFFFDQDAQLFDFEKSSRYNDLIMKKYPEEKELYNLARRRFAIAYYIYFEDMDKSLSYIEGNPEDKRFNTIMKGIMYFIKGARSGLSSVNQVKKFEELKESCRFYDFLLTLYAFAIEDFNNPGLFSESEEAISGKYSMAPDEELIMYFISAQYQEFSTKNLETALKLYKVLVKRSSEVGGKAESSRKYRYSSLEVYAKKAVERLEGFSRDKEKSEYQFFISDSFVRLGQYEKALSVIENLEIEMGMNEDIRRIAILKKAKILSEDMQNYDNARIYLEKNEGIFKKSIYTAEYHHLLADLYLKLGNYSRAISIFEDMSKNAAENELNKQALLKMAYIYEEWADYDKARQKYEKFISISLGSDLGDIARIRLAKLFKEQFKKPVEARSLLSAIVLNPDSPFREQAKEIMDDLFRVHKPEIVKDQGGKTDKKAPPQKEKKSKVYNAEEISTLKEIFSKLKEAEDESRKLEIIYEAGEYFFNTIKDYENAIKFYSMYKAISDEAMTLNNRYYDVIFKLAQSYYSSGEPDSGIVMLEEGISRAADDENRFRLLDQKKKWKNEQGEEAKDTLWNIVKMHQLAEKEGYFNYLTEYYHIMMKEGTDKEINDLIDMLGKYPESFHTVYYRMKLSEKIGEQGKYKDYLKKLSDYSQVADKIDDLLMDENNKKIYHDLIVKYTEFLDTYPFSDKIPFVKMNIARIYLNKLKEFDKGSAMLHQLSATYGDMKEGIEAKALLVKLPYLKEKERLANYLINPDLTDDEKAEAYLRLMEIALFYLFDVSSGQKYENLIKNLKMNAENRAYWAQLVEKKKHGDLFGDGNKDMKINALEDIYFLLDSARLVRKENGDSSFLIRYLNEFVEKYPKFPGINKIYDELILLYQQRQEPENEEKFIWLVLKNSGGEKRTAYLDSLGKMYMDRPSDLITALQGLQSEEKEIVDRIEWLRKYQMVLSMEEQSYNYTVEKGLNYFDKIIDIYRTLGLFSPMYKTYQRIIDGASDKKTKAGYYLKFADEYEKNGEFYDAVKVYRDFLKDFPDYPKTPQLLLYLAKEYARREAFDITVQYFDEIKKKYPEFYLSRKLEKQVLEYEGKKEVATAKGSKSKSKTEVLTSFEALTEKCKEILYDDFEGEEMYDEERDELVARIDTIAGGEGKDYDRILKIAEVLKGKKYYRRTSEFFDSAYEYLSFSAEKKQSPEILLKNAELNEENIENFERTIELYELYFKKAPQNSTFERLHFHIAQLYHLKLQDILKSKENYDVIIDRYPESEYFDDSLLFEGMLYMDEYKEYDRAIEYFQRIIDEKFSSDLADDAQFKIAQIYENFMHDDARAREEYQKVINNFSNSNLYEDAEFAIRRIDERQ